MHHPEGVDRDQMFFRETEIRDLILAYQREPSAETRQAIVMEEHFIEVSDNRVVRS